MRIALIKKLIDLLEESKVDELELTSWWGGRIRLSKSNSRANAGSLVTSGQPVIVREGEVTEVGREIVAAEEEATVTKKEKTSTVELAKNVNLHTVTSPMVATFYRAPAPEAPPYVEVESRVKAGQTLCILEAMKLMNELESDVSGVIKEILVENGEPIEYGQDLFLIEVD